MAWLATDWASGDFGALKYQHMVKSRDSDFAKLSSAALSGNAATSANELIANIALNSKRFQT